MEANLFWIGIGLGIFAYGLKFLESKVAWFKTRAAGVVLHCLFTMSIGSLIGFIFSASTQLSGPTPQWPIVGTLLGLVYGGFQLFREKPEARAGNQLLQDDIEWSRTSYSAILLAAAIMYAVVQAFKIPSGSMEDTLLIGDHLFVNKFIYGVRVPFTDKRIFKIRDVRRGDVVVFEAPSAAITDEDEIRRGVRKDFIKRAIGMPGDVIEIKDKKLFINGKMMNESYPVFREPMILPSPRIRPASQEYQTSWESGLFRQNQYFIRDNFGPVTVPADSYFVMGDNRDRSFDSRFWGPLPIRLLKGKALIVYWPFKRVKIIR